MGTVAPYHSKVPGAARRSRGRLAGACWRGAGLSHGRPHGPRALSASRCGDWASSWRVPLVELDRSCMLGPLRAAHGTRHTAHGTRHSGGCRPRSSAGLGHLRPAEHCAAAEPYAHPLNTTRLLRTGVARPPCRFSLYGCLHCACPPGGGARVTRAVPQTRGCCGGGDGLYVQGRVRFPAREKCKRRRGHSVRWRER